MVNFSEDLTLECVKQSFDHHRSVREKPGPLPNYLWQQAITLLQTHRQADVCRELKISYDQINAKLKSKNPQHRSMPKTQPSSFVEITQVGSVQKNIQSLDPMHKSSTGRLEFKRSDGTVLMVEQVTHKLMSEFLNTFLRGQQ